MSYMICCIVYSWTLGMPYRMPPCSQAEEPPHAILPYTNCAAVCARRSSLPCTHLLPIMICLKSIFSSSASICFSPLLNLPLPLPPHVLLILEYCFYSFIQISNETIAASSYLSGRSINSRCNRQIRRCGDGVILNNSTACAAPHIS